MGFTATRLPFQELQRPQPVGVRGPGQEVHVLQSAAVPEGLSERGFAGNAVR